MSRGSSAEASATMHFVRMMLACADINYFSKPTDIFNVNMTCLWNSFSHRFFFSQLSWGNYLSRKSCKYFISFLSVSRYWKINGLRLNRIEEKQNPTSLKLKELIVDFIPFHWKEHCFVTHLPEHAHTQRKIVSKANKRTRA